MTQTTDTEAPQDAEAATESGENPAGSAPIGAYSVAIGEYIDAASWLTAADAPLKVHARSIAASLDKQMSRTGEIQSALASSFDKVLMRLDARRPGPPPLDPLTEGTGPHGEKSLFSQTMDDA